jgi:hypothetical protein
MRILNIHQRVLRSPPGEVGALLGTLASPDDQLWPGPPQGRWPRMSLDGPLAPGARGGHGPIRYRTVETVPARRVVFEFEQRGWSRELVGTHRFEVDAVPAGAVLRHVIQADAKGWGSVRWRLVLGPLHDALMEDALDQAEGRLTGHLAKPSRWSFRARALRWGLALLGRK